MYLSYSGWKKYKKDCPRAYWHSYVDKTKTPEPDNKVNSLFGSVVGVLFEVFYKERVWRQPDPTQYLLDRVETSLNDVIAKEVKTSGSGCIRWNADKSNYKSPEALLADVRDAVPRGIEIIRHHVLIGPACGAEVKLDASFGAKDEHTLVGRADFVFRQARTNRLIMTDGKGSKYRGQYVDEDQLRWYGGLWLRRTGALPDQLGFVYWRSEPSKAVDWIKFSKRDVIEVIDEALATVEEIETARVRYSVAKNKNAQTALRVLQDTFPAHPGDRCRLCSYSTVCDAGKSILSPRIVSPDPLSGVETQQTIHLEDVDL
jgi:hypothetical protein